jgi:hypothetical protein
MSSLLLRSSNSDATVEIGDVTEHHFQIAVRSHDHSAVRRIYTFPDRDGIARLFAEAANEWSGWNGVKTWESIGDECRVTLAMDRSGHVVLGLRIGCRVEADPWELKADFGFDAGQLETIARDLERLFRSATNRR